MRALLLLSILAHASGFVPGAAPGAAVDALGRRSAFKLAALGTLAAVAAPSPALAEFCSGKCKDPDAEAKAARRKELQLGTSSAPPPTIAGLIEKSIQQQEDVLGMSLSDAEKQKIEERVRAAYPGIQ